MSNYNSLKTTIDANIKQNGNQEITGQILNSVLNQMVTTLGAGYQFAGVATTATNPGSPDAKVFYIANGKGTYTNFGGLEVTEDEVVVLYWDSSWHKVSTGIASDDKLTKTIEHLYNNYITLDSTKNGRVYIHAVGGHTYRIYPITKTWDLTDITNFFAFAWGYRIGDTDMDIAGEETQGFTRLQDYYDVILPDNAEMLMIRAVGAPNQTLYFVVEDTTYANLTSDWHISTYLRNGSSGNESNTKAVSTEIMPINATDKYIICHTDRPNRENCVYRFGVDFTSSLSDIGKKTIASTWDGRIIDGVVDYDSGLLYMPIPTNAVGVCVTIAEYNLNTQSYEDLNVTISGSFSPEKYKIAYSTPGYCGALFKDLFDVTQTSQIQDIATNSVSNSTYVVIDATPRNTYRIYPITKTWDFTGSQNYYVFAWGYMQNDVMVDVDGVEREGFTKLADYYDITIPANINNIAVRAIGKSGEHIYFYVENVTDLKNDTENICVRNYDKIPLLTASCRYRKSSNTSKDFQLLIVTDSHNDNICVNNSVIATNGFKSIDALIHCGDLVDHIMLNQNVDALWKSIAKNCEKPYYLVIGNHEAGPYYPVSTSPSQEQLYNSFIKPSVDAGHLVNGEYIVGKCYYYHDFISANLRLIVLNEYEAPRIPDTTTYWKPITYNSSLPNYADNTTYTIGTQVNVSGYSDYSFEAVSNFNSGDYYDFKSPSVKYKLGYRWISQAQAQWFLDTLASTPSDYKIVVACHNPFSKKANVDQTKIFSQKNNWTDGYGIQDYMVNDFIADAINAFQNKQNFSTTCSSEHPEDMPSYIVSKNFSGVTATFHSLIGGHVHEDCVWKHQDYNQYQITPVCSNSNSYAQSEDADIRRTSSSVANEIDTDCLTVVSFSPNKLGLVKLGVDVTEDGYKRDFEVIDIS